MLAGSLIAALFAISVAHRYIAILESRQRKSR